MGTNLVVVLHQGDLGVSSNITNPVTKDETRLPIDTSYYDGSPTYTWSFVCANADTSARTIYLVDASGATIASQSVPAGQAAYRRYEISFTPNSNDNYRLKFDGTTVANQLKAYDSYIYITQTNATKTRIQIPLVCSGNGASSGSNIDQTTSITYTQITPLNYGYWHRDDAAWGTIPSGGYAFEAVMVIGNGTYTAYVSLFNVTDGTQVTASEVTYTGGTAKTLVTSAGFDSGGNFLDNKDYEVRIKTSNAAASVQMYRACLYITLNPIVKGEVYYRVGHSVTAASSSAYGPQKQKIDIDSFSSPVAYHEATLYYSVSGTMDAGLGDTGTSDTSDSMSVVTGSTLTPTATKALQRSGSITITSGNRYIYDVNRTSGTMLVSAQCVVVAFTAPAASGKKTNSFEDEILKLFFQGVAITGIADNDSGAPLTNLYVAACSADPGEAATAESAEIAYTGYARVAVARSTAGWTVTTGSASNAAAVKFPRCNGGSATVTHLAVTDAASGSGRAFYTSAIDSPATITDGIQLTFPIGAMVVTED